MKQAFRILSAAAGLCVLALLAGLVALRVMFPPERIRKMALERLSASLGREVRIAQVGLSLHGVDLGGIEISEAPDFKAGTFLKVGTLRLRLRLRPLLERRLELSELRFLDLDARIRRGQGGDWNFASLAAGFSAAPPASAHAEPGKPGAGAALASWTLGRWICRNGTLRVEDARTPLSLLLEGIDADARDIRPGRPVSVKLALTYSGKKGARTLRGKLRVKGELDGWTSPERAHARFSELELEHDGLALEGLGEIGNLDAPEWDLRLLVPKPGFAMPAVRLKTSGAMKGDLVSLKETSIRAGPLEASIQGSARLIQGRQPLLDIRLDTNLFQIGDLLTIAPAALQEAKPSGQLRLKARINGSPDLPMISGHAELSRFAFQYAGHALDSIDGSIDFDPRSASSRLKGRWGENPFALDLDARDYREAPKLRLEGTLGELDLSAWTAKAGPLADSEGSARTPAASASTKPLSASGRIRVGRLRHPNFEAAGAELSWDLRQLHMPSNLDGWAKLKVGAGQFDNLKGLGEGKPLLKTALMPLLLLQRATGLAKIPLLPAFDRVRFKEITGDYAFKNGLMTLKECHLDSDAAYVAMSGTADLKNEQLNLRVSTQLGTQLGLKLSGPLGFTVKGTLSRPSVKPDAAAILKQPVVRDALEEGRKLLENLFK